MENDDSNHKSLSMINQQYLKELETNNDLFNQKIKNLNNYLINSDKKNKLNNNRKHNYSYKNFGLNNSQIIERSNNNIKYNFNQRDLNTLDIENNNINDFTFKRKESEKELRDNNMIEINKELKKKIKELKNENEYKDNIINELKEKIKINEENKKININNVFEYNRLILDIEDKNKIIDKLKNVIKFLKVKNEELNTKIDKTTNDNLNLKNKIAELTSDTDYKINYLNSIKKIKELELVNKKLNIEISNISYKYNKIKDDNEKLNSLIDQQNNIIYNLQKQLDSQPENNYISNNSDINKNSIDINIDNIDSYKYKNNLKRKENFYDSNIIKNKRDNLLSSYDYDKSDYNLNSTNNSLSAKKNLNYFENYLSTLLKERCQLENDLNEIMNSPRTLSDIKLKNNISDKIALNDNEIQKTKNKLKKLRGY